MSVKQLSFTDNNAPQCDAEFLNSTKDEINNTIVKTGQSLAVADRFQLAKAVKDFTSSGDFFVDSGAVNAYVLTTLTPFQPARAYTDGMRVRARLGNSNTGASTVNVDGIGSKAIKKFDLDTSALVALAEGDIIEDAHSLIEFDIDEDCFVLISNGIISAASDTIIRNFISGYTTELSSDTDHDVVISEGIAVNSTSESYITLSAPITKQIDQNWVAGSNNGGFPSSISIAADTWYHMFVISDGTNVDAGFDDNINATNLLADSGYTTFRRIGSVLTDSSSNIKPYKQFSDIFMWDDFVEEINETATISTLTDLNITVPEGLVTLAILSGLIADNTTANTQWILASNVAGGEYQFLSDASSNSNTVHNNSSVEILADENANIQQRSTGTSGQRVLICRGWRDFRGDI